MSTLLTFIAADAFWLQVLRFVLGSTIILGAARLAIQAGLIQQLRLQSLLWKCAVCASLVLLLPLPGSVTPEVTLKVNNQTLITNLTQSTASLTQPRMTAALPALANNTPLSLTDRRAPEPSLLLLVLWASISTFLIIRQRRLHHSELQKLGERPAVDAYSSLRKEFVAQCRRKNIYPLPRLTVSEKLASPVTLPNNEVCLPARMLKSISSAEMSCVLAHELGHIKNKDIQLMAVMQVLVSLFFFQPLLRIAQRELMDLAEFIADQEAVSDQQTGDQLATALVNCAHRVGNEPAPVYAVAMVGKASRLRARVEQLMGDGPFTAQQPSNTLKGLLAAGVIGSAFLLPVFAQDSAEPSTAQSEHAAYQAIACNSAGYEAIVDHVHAGVVSPQDGLARWETSCGTESGKEIDSTWQQYNLSDHHLWFMANSEDPNSAGQTPAMSLLYRAWMASQSFREHTRTHDQEHDQEQNQDHEHDSAH